MSIIIHVIYIFNFVVSDYRYKCLFYITKIIFKFNEDVFRNTQ